MGVSRVSLAQLGDEEPSDGDWRKEQDDTGSHGLAPAASASQQVSEAKIDGSFDRDKVPSK